MQHYNVQLRKSVQRLQNNGESVHLQTKGPPSLHDNLVNTQIQTRHRPNSQKGKSISNKDNSLYSKNNS